jgi:hypothetical protein
MLSIELLEKTRQRLLRDRETAEPDDKKILQAAIHILDGIIHKRKTPRD